MTASNATVMCFVHRAAMPRAAAHEHHEAPRAAGGSDDKDNLVWLCATCHQVAHRVAQLMMLGKNAAAIDIATSTYSQPQTRKLFLQVVNEIVIAHLHAQEAGVGKPKAEVMLELDHKLYHHLKTLAQDHRANGRKVGVAKYIEAVLTKHVRQNGLF